MEELVGPGTAASGEASLTGLRGELGGLGVAVDVASVNQLFLPLWLEE